MNTCANCRSSNWIRWIAQVFVAGFRLTFSLGLIVFFLWVILKGYTYITSSPVFALKQVRIQGNYVLSEKKILSWLQLKKGMNLFQLKIDQLNYKLNSNPWVKTSIIKRELPDTLVITIQEKEPCFLGYEKGKVYYLDQNGQKIEQVDYNNYVSLPVLAVQDKTALMDQDLMAIRQVILNGLFPFNWQDIGLVVLSEDRLKIFVDSWRIWLVLDKTTLRDSVFSLKTLVKHLMATGQKDKIEQIVVIKNKAWVAFKK